LKLLTAKADIFTWPGISLAAENASATCCSLAMTAHAQALPQPDEHLRQRAGQHDMPDQLAPAQPEHLAELGQLGVHPRGPGPSWRPPARARAPRPG
jgi:hypothetical protein